MSKIYNLLSFKGLKTWLSKEGGHMDMMSLTQPQVSYTLSFHIFVK